MRRKKTERKGNQSKINDEMAKDISSLTKQVTS